MKAADPRAVRPLIIPTTTRSFASFGNWAVRNSLLASSKPLYRRAQKPRERPFAPPAIRRGPSSPGDPGLPAPVDAASAADALTGDGDSPTRLTDPI